MAVIGRATVERELATLERRFAQHARKLQAATGGSSAGGGGSGRGLGSGPSSNLAAVDRSIAKAMRDKLRMNDQARRMEATLAREKVSHEKTVAKAQQRTHADAQRAIDRQLRAQASLARQRVREERSVGRERERIVNARSDFARSTIGGGASRVMRGISAVGQQGTQMLGLGGAALAANAVNTAVNLDERTRRLVILGREKGEKGLDHEALRKQFVQTGLTHGVSAESVAGGVEAYTAKTGDIHTALKNQRIFSTVAQGSGADVKDVFSAAADLATKLDVSSVEDMSAAFAVLSAQGKKGSFELKAMAAEFPEILAAAANTGVRGVGGVRDVGALMQVARQASGSDAEATTAAVSFYRKLAQESGKLASGEALGGNKKVQVFKDNDPTKQMLPQMEIFEDFMRKSEGDIVAFQKTFDIRGSKAGSPLANAYREARNKALDGDAANGIAPVSKEVANEVGIVAMKGVWSRFRDVSADFGEVQRDAADAMKSTSVQLEILNTSFKEAIGSKLLPELNKLIPVLMNLIPSFVAAIEVIKRFVQFFAENPMQAVIAALVVSVAYEVTKAKLGNILTEGLKRVMSIGMPAVSTDPNGGGGPALPGGGGSKFGLGFSKNSGASLAGTVGAIGTGLAAGITVASAIFTVGVAKFENNEAEMNDSGEMLKRIRNAGAGDIEMVKEMRSKLRKRATDAEEGSWTDMITGDEDKQMRIKTSQSFFEEADKKLAVLEKQAAAAEAQQKAAEAGAITAAKLDAAADKLGGVKIPPNREDTPQK